MFGESRSNKLFEPTGEDARGSTMASCVHMKVRVGACLRFLFWVCVASIPVAMDHQVTTFMDRSCMPGSECLNHAMPFIVQVGLVNWVAKLLLWPLAAWKLCGQQVWRRVRANRIEAEPHA